MLILADYLYIGGAEVVIKLLYRSLDRKLFDVEICCLKEIGELGEELLKEGFDISVLPKRIPLKNNYLSFVELRRIVKEKNIRVLHSHTTQSLIDGSLVKMTLRNVKLIHTFHFGNYPHQIKKYLLLEKIFSRIPDRLVAVGDEQKKSIVRAFGLQENRILTVWNGVATKGDPSSFSFVENYRVDGKIIVGTVCTLIEQKGLFYLLEVAASLKQKGMNVLFLIAGGGRLRQTLEIKAKDLGIDKSVIFLGWVQNAAEVFIPHIDIFFLPSLWEAMSVVVLEAMAAEKAVVVTSVGENPHVVVNGKNGFVVEPGNVKQMTNALETLVLNQPLRIEMGKKAGMRVEKLFSAEKMTRNYEQLYWDVCYGEK